LELNHHLGVSKWVDFVHCIARCSASFSVKIIRLYKDGVITSTVNPNITLPSQVQLDALSYVKPRLLTGIRPMHITQRPQAETVATTWVNVAINHCVVPGGRNFENLTHLRVKFKVAYATPKFRHKEV